jgi:UDP-N-acetylglucosamine/UDP-N-acetylgalactosamine diphosphorylase
MAGERLDISPPGHGSWWSQELAGRYGGTFAGGVRRVRRHRRLQLASTPLAASAHRPRSPGMNAPKIDTFALTETLERTGQKHLLAHLATLAGAEREAFAQRLTQIDWEELREHAGTIDTSAVGSSRVVTFAERAKRAAELEAAGEAAYRSGQVAVLMVAGGQGTRLGFSGPKGCFGVAPHSGKTIYQLQAEKVLSLSRRIGRAVPFLVMTSPMTDAETREFFAANGWFGLASDQVRFFSQGTVPSLDQQGRALLAGPGKLLENPDGHGGCFTALVKSGNLARLRAEGVRQIVYIQVDNILVPVDDPQMVGLAIAERADVISKVLAKAHPDEKVGHLVRIGGRDRVIEYTEVTPEQVRSVNAQGEPIYRWGSPAMCCWGVDFLARLADAGYKLPLHRSAKPLKAWSADQRGQGAIQEVKGWKNERFIFDLIPEAATSLGLEIDRDAEFAPVKNATGVDSAASAVELAHKQYAAWLQAAGVRVKAPPEARIEISPLFAATRAQFLAKWDKRIAEVTGDYYLEG